MLNTEVKKSIRKKFEEHLDFDCKCEFYGTKIPAPDIFVNLGKDCYFDHKENSITIGLMHPTFSWCSNIDEEYQNSLYVSGHEKQHRKSTTAKASMNATKRGCEVIIEEMAKKYAISSRFIKDSDYEYVLGELAKKGLKFKFGQLSSLVHFVFNAIEDGRIERIRSQKNEVFRATMKAIRLRGWNDSGIESINDFGEVDKMSATNRCNLVFNQILDLATTGYYQKGFAIYYFGTELQDYMNSIIPNIAKGVLSPSCKGCAEQSIEICRKLADLIAEASKMSDFEKMLQEIIKNMVNNLGNAENTDECGSASCSEKEEEEGEDNGSTPFENTDLFIELDDETFDKLNEQNQDDPEEETEGAFKVHVKREHPLPSNDEKTEEQSQEQESCDGSPESDDEAEDTENSGTKSTKDEESKDKEDENTNSSSDQNSSHSSENAEDSDDIAEDGKSSDNDLEEGEDGSNTDSDKDTNNEESSESSDKEDESTSKSSKENAIEDTSTAEKEDSDCESSNSDTKDTWNKKTDSKNSEEQNRKKPHSLSGTTESDEDIEEIEKRVREMMNKAAEEAAGLVEGIEENIENTLKQTIDMQKGEDVVEPLQPMDVTDIQKEYRYHIQFKEMERSYEVTDNMPPVLCMEIMKMQKTFEKYLRSKKAKKLKNRYSGSVDTERLGMLAANQIDCFKETKTIKGTKACALLMVDNSGSMGYGKGSKREFANTALAKAEMTFAKYFPVKIFAYDEQGAVIHEVIKNWGEKFTKSSAWNFLNKGRGGCGNMDGFSIRVATQDILSRPEKRKLIVVLSDGLPDDCSDVKDAVQKARRAGIKVVAIYFSDYPDSSVERQFEEMYEKDFIITEPENIGEELIKNLKSFFL